MIDSSSDRDIRYLVSESTDPAVNLALEETLFSRFPAGQSILLLYRNAPSVIFGRFQNPWLEADVDWLEAQKLPVIRRMSGGGAVWHDLANWNFSFMLGHDRFDQKKNLGFLVGILAVFGFALEMNSRGDLLLDGRKVSGNAMVKKRDRVLHHCSLLVDSDLGRLRKALRPSMPEGLKVSSHGVASLRSPVTRLADHASPELISRLWDDLKSEIAGKLRLLPVPPLATELRESGPLEGRNRDWQWNFGHSPEFSIEVLTGTGEKLTIKNGFVQSGRLADANNLSDKAFPGFAALARMGIVGFNDR